MEFATQVQIFDKVICFSFPTYALFSFGINILGTNPQDLSLKHSAIVRLCRGSLEFFE